MFNITTLRLQSVFLLILSAALAVGIGLLMAEGNYEWQGLLLSILAIGVATCFLLPRMSRLDDWKPLSRILTAGLILKLGFSLLLIWIGFVVYGGMVDATRYHYTGTQIAHHVWQLQFDQVSPFLHWGTNSIELFTGIMYSITGPTLYGGYLIYAFLGFLGSYFFYRAFRVAFPQGNRQLYAVLVFFFPSLLLWSNGIGKDALIFLFIGLLAYGGAQLYRNRLSGFVLLALGLLGVMWIRPHVAAILAIAFIIGFLVPGRGKGTARPVISVIGLLVVGGFVWFLLPQLMPYLMIEELSPEGVLSVLQRQQSLTFTGGSAFQSVDISNPLNFPMAMVTVLFRPFPWEAHNLLALVQSLEGLIFAGLVLWRVKSLGKALVSSISNAYVRFILIFIVAFIVAYSSVQNFGTLVRWRTMMFPFFLILMAYAPSDTRRRSELLEKFQTCAI
ncbi:hypothetical protein ACFLXU_05000 [Chloroflexota bacterium]